MFTATWWYHYRLRPYLLGLGLGLIPFACVVCWYVVALRLWPSLADFIIHAAFWLYVGGVIPAALLCSSVSRLKYVAYGLWTAVVLNPALTIGPLAIWLIFFASDEDRFRFFY